MDQQGGYHGPGRYIPRDPNAPVIYDDIYMGPPSQYIDPASVQAAPYNPNASPIEAQRLPYVPAEPPDLSLENQKTLKG